MSENPYQRLADRLDALPNGFPSSATGIELRMLEALYTPEQADLASKLRLTKETPQELAERIGGEPRELRLRLKEMTRHGLIAAGRTPTGLGYGLLPFVVGVWEMQANVLTAELAELFETYFHEAFGPALAMDPPVHRVIPVGESVDYSMEISPTETIMGIIDRSQSFGVMDCICRKELELLGKPCGHPLDVCMTLSPLPGAYAQSKNVRALTREEAIATLKRAADAGLVHTVTNNLEGVTYICNCCSCGCGILRGMSELGVANVVARSRFVNRVDGDLCIACGLCADVCPFGALEIADVCQVDTQRCAGCGVCLPVCPQEALSLIDRPECEWTPPPETMDDWMRLRAERRGIDMSKVL